MWFYIEPTDYTQLWNDMRENISLVSGGVPTPGQGTFGHIAGGYDAGTFRTLPPYVNQGNSQVNRLLRVSIHTTNNINKKKSLVHLFWMI